MSQPEFQWSLGEDWLQPAKQRRAGDLTEGVNFDQNNPILSLGEALAGLLLRQVESVAIGKHQSQIQHAVLHRQLVLEALLEKLYYAPKYGFFVRGEEWI